MLEFNNRISDRLRLIPIYKDFILTFTQDKSPFDIGYTIDKINVPFYKNEKLLAFMILFYSIVFLLVIFNINETIILTGPLCISILVLLTTCMIETRGINLYNRGQYQEAINVFYQYSKITKYQAGLMLDYCFNKLNRPEDCINILQKFKPASYRIKIFYQYLVLKQYDYAIKYLNETISDTELQRHPLSASIIAMAFLYLKNDPAKAIEYIKSKKFIFTQTTSIIETGAQVWLSYNQIRAISKGKFSDMFFINEMQNSITDDSQNSYEFEINIIKYILSICYEKIGDTQSKERIEEEIRVSKIPNIANSKYFIELKNFFTDFAKANV